MKVLTSNFESQKFRKLFEAMKEYGVEPFNNFFDEYSILRQQDLMKIAVLNGKHKTWSFVRKYADILRKIRELAVEDDEFLFSADFMNLVSGVTDENISQCIDGAYSLEELGVAKVFSLDSNNADDFITVLYFRKDKVSDIRKFYTNGNIRYEAHGLYANTYDTYVDFEQSLSGNFVIKAENHHNGLQFRDAYISDFLFDTNQLPTKKDLASLEAPESLIKSKVYIKR